MEKTYSQNLRVISRRLATELDDKFLTVLKEKLGQPDQYWGSRTGAMMLAASNVFFRRGNRGAHAFKLGRTTAIAFYNINHNKGTPNIVTEVANACKGGDLTADEMVAIVDLLNGYFSVREKEKLTPSVVNAVVNKIANRLN